MSDEELFNTLKAAKRKRSLFGYKTLYEPTTSNSEEQLRNLELSGGYHFPADVRDTLLSLGGCAVDELYIHPSIHPSSKQAISTPSTKKPGQ